MRTSETPVAHSVSKLSGTAMARGSRGQLFWRALDVLACWLTLSRLHTLDALLGPEPETPADQQRQRERDRIEKAFPEIKM